MKRMNQKRFTANYVKPVKTKEHTEHKKRINKILNMIDIDNINIEMFDFLLENKTFKKEIEKSLKLHWFGDIESIKDFLSIKKQINVIRTNGLITFQYFSIESINQYNNIIKQAFNKAIKRNHYLIEDFELMFAY